MTMKKAFPTEFVYQVFSLLIAFILVHAIYVTLIRPQAPKSDSSKSNSKKPNNGGNGTGPRRGGSKKPAAKTDENAQNPWAKRQSVGGSGQRRRRPANND